MATTPNHVPTVLAERRFRTVRLTPGTLVRIADAAYRSGGDVTLVIADHSFARVSPGGTPPAIGDTAGCVFVECDEAAPQESNQCHLPPCQRCGGNADFAKAGTGVPLAGAWCLSCYGPAKYRLDQMCFCQVRPKVESKPLTWRDEKPFL